MRKLKTVAIWSLLAFLVLINIMKISYYQHMFSQGLSYRFIDNVLNISTTLLGFLFVSFYIVLGIMALASADRGTRDRAYSLLRFVYVIHGLISLPLTIIQTVTFAKYTFANPTSAFSFLIGNAIWL